MIYEIAGESFPKVKRFHERFSDYVVLTSLVEGQTPGRIWVDDTSEPSYSLTWDMVNGFLFLVGGVPKETPGKEPAGVLRDVIIPEARRLGFPELNLHIESRTWERYLHPALERAEIARRHLHLYVLHPEKASQLARDPAAIPSDFELTQITQRILEDTSLRNIDEVRGCIEACWPSREAYSKNGIGYCLLHGDTIVSWCSTDFVRPGACDLYVETFGGYKRRGFGTLVSRACINDCLTRGLSVHWHCWEDNVASVGLARRLGLEKTVDHSVITIILSADWTGAAEPDF